MTSSNLAIPERALAIAAHPDDIEFGCGATLAKWAEGGCEVSLLICTDGSKGTWDLSSDTAALVARRQDEQREAARRLGATGDVRFLENVDGELNADLANRSMVAMTIRELLPTVLLGHDPWQRWRLHPDHRAAGFLCTDGVVAARDPHFFPEHGVPHHRPHELLLFECEAPDHVESVEARHVEAKANALLAHESQFESTHEIAADDDGTSREAFRNGIEGECRDAGRRIGSSYGESFRRPVGL